MNAFSALASLLSQEISNVHDAANYVAVEPQSLQWVEDHSLTNGIVISERLNDGLSSKIKGVLHTQRMSVNSTTSLLQLLSEKLSSLGPNLAERIDLLEIDIQGAEQFAFFPPDENLMSFLRAHVDMIIVATHSPHIHQVRGRVVSYSTITARTNFYWA